MANNTATYAMKAPKVTLKPLAADLFSDVAEQAAQACIDQNRNKPAQLRRFYDELVMWHDKVFALQTVTAQQAKFEELLPFIKMLRAKAAYAAGRKLINETFKNLFDDVIRQVQGLEELRNAKLFFEAFLGYMKYYDQSK